MYVASMCPQCFICFFKHMLQMCLSRCYICFTHMLQMFYLHVVYVNNGFQVFFVSVLDICFKCFICLQTYVASIASECFKSRSSVAHLMRVKSGKGRQRSPLGRGPLDGRMKSRHGRGCRRAPGKRIVSVHGIVWRINIWSDVWATVVPTWQRPVDIYLESMDDTGIILFMLCLFMTKAKHNAPNKS
jgi:hypothetical protein